MDLYEDSDEFTDETYEQLIAELKRRMQYQSSVSLGDGNYLARVPAVDEVEYVLEDDDPYQELDFDDSRF